MEKQHCTRHIKNKTKYVAYEIYTTVNEETKEKLYKEEDSFRNITNVIKKNQMNSYHEKVREKITTS